MFFLSITVHGFFVYCHMQAKMVKAFDNFAFARDAWMFLVAPSWYSDVGFVRVGSLVTTGAFSVHVSKPQLMPGPIRPGTLVYSQEVNCFWGYF